MTFNHERAATILVDAAYLGDPKAAQRNGCSERTIRNYRDRLESDEEFAALFQKKCDVYESRWADALAEPMRAAAEFLTQAATRANVQNAEVITAIAGALKIMADVRVTKEILDVRLAQVNRREGAEDRSVVAGYIAEATVVDTTD